MSQAITSTMLELLKQQVCDAFAAYVSLIRYGENSAWRKQLLYELDTLVLASETLQLTTAKIIEFGELYLNFKWINDLAFVWNKNCVDQDELNLDENLRDHHAAFLQRSINVSSIFPLITKVAIGQTWSGAFGFVRLRADEIGVSMSVDPWLVTRYKNTSKDVLLATSGNFYRCMYVFMHLVTAQLLVRLPYLYKEMSDSEFKITRKVPYLTLFV